MGLWFLPPLPFYQNVHLPILSYGCSFMALLAAYTDSKNIWLHGLHKTVQVRVVYFKNQEELLKFYSGSNRQCTKNLSSQ